MMLTITTIIAGMFISFQQTTPTNESRGDRRAELRIPVPPLASDDV